MEQECFAIYFIISQCLSMPPAWSRVFVAGDENIHIAMTREQWLEGGREGVKGMLAGRLEGEREMRNRHSDDERAVVLREGGREGERWGEKGRLAGGLEGEGEMRKNTHSDDERVAEGGRKQSEIARVYKYKYTCWSSPLCPTNGFIKFRQMFESILLKCVACFRSSTISFRQVTRQRCLCTVESLEDSPRLSGC